MASKGSRVRDPLDFLTLEKTFCIQCYRAGKRPADMPDAVLGGVRFGRAAKMSARAAASYRSDTRKRVLAHLARHHTELAVMVFPVFMQLRGWRLIARATWPAGSQNTPG